MKISTHICMVCIYEIDFVIAELAICDEVNKIVFQYSIFTLLTILKSVLVKSAENEKTYNIANGEATRRSTRVVEVKEGGFNIQKVWISAFSSPWLQPSC